nr:hypothetical protein [Pseudochrobactrum asaccharolyticum]
MRALTDKARAGDISVGSMLMAASKNRTNLRAESA